MDSPTIQDSVACCGLICRLCFLAARCGGCRMGRNLCDQDCSDAGCFQKKCCTSRRFEGCWQCGHLAACTEGIYRDGDFSKVKAFALCIQEDGLDAFVGHVLRNRERGLSVEKGKDYDGKSVGTVLRLLRTGQA